MKKLAILAVTLMIGSTSCHTNKQDVRMSLEENKKISTLYHERNLKDIDNVLSVDFVGSYFLNETTPIMWSKEDHRNTIISVPDMRDSILVQIAEDDWVATRFLRTIKNEESNVKLEVMQFKQFKNGKIIRSWEIFSPIQEINDSVTKEMN